MADPSKYTGNSKTDREAAKSVPSITDVPTTPEKREGAVVKAGSASIKKPSLGKRFRENFVGEDANTVGSYLIQEIVVPAIKSTIVDLVSQGIERMLYGEVRRPSRVPGSKQYTPYSTISSQPKSMKPDPRESSSSVMRPQSYDEISFTDRGSAEVVLERMFEQVKEYNLVTVSNFYDFAAVSNSANWQDNKWGWTVEHLHQTRVQGTPRQGYFLTLPRPVPID